jgi:hypothetical protein
MHRCLLLSSTAASSKKPCIVSAVYCPCYGARMWCRLLNALTRDFVCLVHAAAACRVNFTALCVFISLWHLVVYCPLAHMAWHPAGALKRYGILDFAGGGILDFAGITGSVPDGQHCTQQVAQLCTAAGLDPSLIPDVQLIHPKCSCCSVHGIVRSTARVAPCTISVAKLPYTCESIHAAGCCRRHCCAHGVWMERAGCCLVPGPGRSGADLREQRACQRPIRGSGHYIAVVWVARGE